VILTCLYLLYFSLLDTEAKDKHTVVKNCRPIITVFFTTLCFSFTSLYQTMKTMTSSSRLMSLTVKPLQAIRNRSITFSPLSRCPSRDNIDTSERQIPPQSGGDAAAAPSGYRDKRSCIFRQQVQRAQQVHTLYYVSLKTTKTNILKNRLI